MPADLPVQAPTKYKLVIVEVPALLRFDAIAIWEIGPAVSDALKRQAQEGGLAERLLWAAFTSIMVVYHRT
jgi:hypothetical protein